MGGARKGAGRPKGVKETKPRETAARKFAAEAAKEGLLPAEIMLRTARHLYAQATDADGEITDTEMAMSAVAVADKAAPYFNARLASMTVKGDPENPLSIDSPIETTDRAKALANLLLPMLAAAKS